MALADVFSVALREGAVTQDRFSKQAEKWSLKQCFKQGWLHADPAPHAPNTPHFFFASPLHRWFVEWHLADLRMETSISEQDLLQFILNVLARFSPSRLSPRVPRYGTGGLERPPDTTRYQDEFYRCCHTHAHGCVVSLPEFGRPMGRANLLIPTKSWGVELVCEGRGLGRWIASSEMEDRMVLDLRRTPPVEARPGGPVLGLFSLLFRGFTFD